jgi:hypothetical protein
MNNNRAVYSFCYHAWKERDAYLREACCVVHRNFIRLADQQGCENLGLKSFEEVEALVNCFLLTEDRGMRLGKVIGLI